jgi:hypothetical protein
VSFLLNAFLRTAYQCLLVWILAEVLTWMFF